MRRGTNKAENREAWGGAWGTRRMVARGFVGRSVRLTVDDLQDYVQRKRAA